MAFPVRVEGQTLCCLVKFFHLQLLFEMKRLSFRVWTAMIEIKQFRVIGFSAHKYLFCRRLKWEKVLSEIGCCCEAERKSFSALVLPLIIYSNHQLMFGSFLISCRGSFSQDRRLPFYSS